MLRAMASVEVEEEIAAPIDQVWALVSDFGGLLPKMGIPAIARGEGIGMTRTVDREGPRLTERLEEIDEANHTVCYTIVEGPIPAKDYRAWMALTAAGEGRTTIRWHNTFEPTGDEEQVAGIFRGAYVSGIASMRKALGVE